MGFPCAQRFCVQIYAPLCRGDLHIAVSLPSSFSLRAAV